MFERLARSWEIAKTCATVLTHDVELLMFPVLSGLATLCVLATFALPVAASMVDGVVQIAPVPMFAALLLFYVVQAFVIVYFQVALVGAALVRLDGGNPTLADGFAAANTRLGSIFAWSIVSATVGAILKSLESRESGPLARTAGRIAGVAWALATAFVIPLVVTRGLGPFEALRESASLIRRTWGEQLVGTFGLTALFGLVGVVWTLPWGLSAMVAMETGHVVLAVLAGLGCVVGLVVVGVVQAAMTGVWQAALFRYAERGQVVWFDGGLLANAASR